MHQNIEGLKKKTNRLTHLLEDVQPKVLILTEHGLKEEILKNIRIPGYSLAAHFSRTNYTKGGVAIYVEENIVHLTEPIPVSQYCQELICEIAMIKLTLNKKQLYITGIYRSPSGNLKQALSLISEMLEETKADNHPIMILGDINVDCLKNDHANKQLNNVLISHNIERLNIPPTRITPNSSSSIDCICTNLHSKHIENKVFHTGLSDHTAQLCIAHLKNSSENTNHKKVLNRSFCQNNLNTFNSLLLEENWNEVLNAPTAEEAYNKFISIVTMAMEQACPLRKIRTKKKVKNKHFADNQARMLKENFLQILLKYEKSNNDQDKYDLTKAKKEYDMKLRALRQEASAQFIHNAENKTKALWKLINNERQDKTAGQQTFKLEIDGQLENNTNNIANYMNEFFTSIAEMTVRNNPRQLKNPYPTVSTTDHDLQHFQYANPKEIYNIIKNLKTKTSSAIDNISTKVLKHCKNSLTLPLTCIVNKSLSQGQFPSALKLAKVFPKHKTGSKTIVSNYRPISIIPTFSKILEKVVLRRLLDHCEEFNLLTTRQHGFIKGKSTTTALINLADFIIDSLEEGKLVTSLFLDLSKAFDCLGHDLILYKLEKLGIKGTAKMWFKSYLEDRRQVVEIKQTKDGVPEVTRSIPLPVNRGVPQGSILGPVLFVLFTNDMPKYLETFCTISMYADDTTLLLSGKKADDLDVTAYTALNMAYQYCHSNDLVVNPEKTSQLAFGRRCEEVPTIPEVERNTQVKYLGVVLDEGLTWSQHIDNLLSKLNSSLYVIKRTKSISNISTAKIAYYSLFEAHLRYGLVVWGGTSAGNLQRVLVLQKRAIRALAELGFRESCRDAFRTLKIMTVVNLYIKEIIMYADGQPLTQNRHLHDYNTRYGTRYHLPVHHLSQYEKKPSYMGMKLHNLLPEELRCLSSKRLKTALQDWLINNPFYTITEFIERGQ